MICGYCRARNSEEEHRCVRCGRRLQAAAPRPAPDTYPIVSGAAAPDLRPSLQPVARTARPLREAIPESPVNAPQNGAPAFQASLFGPQPVPRVVEMPGPKREWRQPSQSRTVKRSASTTVQQALDFLPPMLPRRAAEDAVIQCDAPVAPLSLRIVAAAIDLSFVLCAVGVFLFAVAMAGVDVVVPNREVVLVYGGAVMLLAAFYKALFVLANGDTPGVRSVRMRVVNFDGRPPSMEQRAFRYLGGALSVLAATLGLLWALVDEESLTWHDHISRTFPTAAPLRTASSD